MRQFAHAQAVAHRHRAGANKTFPARPQCQPFDRPAGGVRAVENPHRFAMLRGGFQHITQRRDEGVNAAAEILQIDQQHVETVHHRGSRAAYFAVQAEYRDAVQRVEEIGRFDHVVLLVAAQAMLRAEGGAQIDVGQGHQRVERMGEVGRYRGRVGEQRHAATGQRAAQGGVGEQAVDAELNGLGHVSQGFRASVKLWRRWKSGWAAPWASAQ